MLFSLRNDHLFSPPSSKPKTLLNSSPTIKFFIFPCPPSKVPRLPHKPLVCRPSSAAAADSDTRTLPQSAIQRIAEKLRSLGYVEDEKEKNDHRPNQGSSPGQIFVPFPTQLPKLRVGHTLDPSWSTPENPVPDPGAGNAITRFHELRRGVIKERIEERSKNRGNVPTLAELTLPKEELRRLRALGIGLNKKLKVGKAGITEGIVNGIHERWRRSELVKITCEDICRMNMKRTHELLERKTGGLVIWRSGSNIILYRGGNYKYPYFLSEDNSRNDASEEASLDLCTGDRDDGREACSSDVMTRKPTMLNSLPPLIQGVGSPNRVRFQLPGEAQLAEEADHLLEGLGPRFTDWWGYEPLPVDADLLPAVIPGYRRPFRLLPYGVKPILTNDEMTTLRRLVRPLPCHFALGRNRKLQGLASSIIKLWEKCEIAKIAVKRGVQNTNSEMMAEELKHLTGGTLLSRDKEFIVLYRGKDYLPAAFSSAIEERRKHGLGGREEGRAEKSSSINSIVHGKLTSEHVTRDEKSELAFEQRKLRSMGAAVERTNTRLSQALAKKASAEKLLAELENEEISKQPEIDKEGITEEERYMLRKVGLRMKPFLLLGRRGVFAGTIENMHLHWKYRELVKIITGGRSIEEVHGVARTLEAESGGILVAVERVSKGYAVIVYRGKNYIRPASLRPRTLLNKREAMKRSIEAQRRESLELHVLKLTKNIDDLKLQLKKDKHTSDMQLNKESELRLVEEQENIIQSAESRFSVASADSCIECFTGSSCNQQVTGAGSYSTSTKLNDCASDSSNFLHIASQDLPRDMSVYEPEPLLESIANQTKVLPNTNDVDETTEPSSCCSSFKTSSSSINKAQPRLHYTRTTKSFVDSPKSELKLSVNKLMENGYKAVASTPARLSNKERLLLRKQALKMKKRPPFAIGKSNVVSGVGESIKAHFQKHPLAIVNVKGRAKGTSVQEVVVKLEEVTGAVLVSQEPSKVILYRGWGAEVEPTHSKGKSGKDLSYSAGRDGRAQHVISPELISAIKLECGLQFDGEKRSAP